MAVRPKAHAPRAIAPELVAKIRAANRKFPAYSAFRLARMLRCTLSDVQAAFAGKRNTTNPMTVADALASPNLKMSKVSCAAGDCTRCHHRPPPGAVFEETACFRCPYLGARSGEDLEPREEGHGRVVSFDVIEAATRSTLGMDEAAEAAMEHAEAEGTPGDDLPAAGDFYGAVDLHLEADARARRTAETLGRTHSHTMPTDSKPTLPPPPPHVSGEASPKNYPENKPSLPGVTASAWDAVPQDARDVFVTALAEIGKLQTTALVGVMKRLAGQELSEIAGPLGVTPAAISSAIQRAAAQVPFLRFLANTKRGGNTNGVAGDPDRRRHMVENGKKSGQYAGFVAMADSGALAKWAKKTFADGPLKTGELNGHLSALTMADSGNPLSIAAWELMLERGIVAEVLLGNRIICGMPEQVRKAKAGYGKTGGKKPPSGTRHAFR